ncbi:MAG: hypothetical protein Q9163_001344 [Psora crenata]
MILSRRVPRPALARAPRQQAVLPRRGFLAPTAPRRDIVQDLYLREIKNYKPTPLKPSDAHAYVQEFKLPKAPRSPEESDIAKDLRAYEDQQVDVEGQTASKEQEDEWDWFEEDPEWEEYYRKEAEKEAMKKEH